jgi:hypothetical protein
MIYLFTGLFFVALLTMIIGLFNPGLVLSWSKQQTRGTVILIFGCLAMASACGLFYFYTDSKPISVVEPTEDQYVAPRKDIDNNPLFKVNFNKMDGYIDSKGVITIEPKFSIVYDFSEGLAQATQSNLVYEKPKWGFINKRGEWVVEPKFNDASRFNEGKALVKVGSKYGFIDTSGKYIIEPHYEEAHMFFEGLAAVKINNKWGFLDDRDNVVIKPDYNDVWNFSEGLAAVSVDGKRGYINKFGKMMIEPKFDTADSFSEGMAVVRIGDDKTGKEGFINRQGKLVIATKFDSALNFSEGYAWVGLYTDNGRSKKWCRINQKGEQIRKWADDARPYSDGLSAMRVGDDKTGKWGYVDINGEIVINPCYDWAAEFKNGLANVKLGENWCYIDKTGRVVWSPPNAPNN